MAGEHRDPEGILSNKVRQCAQKEVKGTIIWGASHSGHSFSFAISLILTRSDLSELYK